MKLQVLDVTEHEGRPCYEVLYENQKYFINLYKFQESEVIPHELDCNIKILGGQKVSITQNISPLLKERYIIGNQYDFIVRNDFTRSGYYELIDNNGFYFRLNATEEGPKLYIGQEVTCRVLNMADAYVNLELVSFDNSNPDLELGEEVSTVINDEYLVEYIMDGKFADCQLNWDIEQLIKLVFINEDAYQNAVNQWVLHELQKFKEIYDYKKIICILKEMRDAILYILEETDCLSACDVHQRKFLQERLSVIGVAIKNYLKVVGYFEKGVVEEKTERLLNNLETSGYIFQATEQLEIMMRIFSLNKEMMERYMERFFAIIHGKDIKYWKNEPFRKAFIKLLELFISEKKGMMDIASSSNKESIRPIIEALSILLLLGNAKDDGDIFDYNLNRAMLYRYASYLKTSTPKYALQNAFFSLMDVNQTTPEYAWRDTMSHELLASKLSVDLTKDNNIPSYSKMYSEGEIKLDINDEGINITPLKIPEEKLKNALPTELLPWNHIQIRLKAAMATIYPSKVKDLSTYQRLWKDIERELFAPNEPKVVHKIPKIKPTQGDTYTVRILYKDNENRWVCRIVDDYVEGDGYINARDIVPYNVNITLNSFRKTSTNESLLFKLKVVNIDNDEKCHFSALRLVNDCARDMVGYSSRIPCLITGEKDGQFLGVGHNGISVRLVNKEEFPELKQQYVAFASYWESAGNCTYKGNILTTEEAATHFFTVEDAFNELMLNCSCGTYCDFTEDTSTEVLQQENRLDKTRATELISIIDRLATLESDYLVTYNYLGFAKIFAKILNDNHRYDFYNGWMKLIAILHHFAVNGAVPTADLYEFETSSSQLFYKKSEIHHRYIQLKIVSYKGKPEYNNELWQFTMEDDETIKNLAKCVLAYNLLGAGTNAATQQDIEEKMQDLLKIKDRSAKLRDFGDEDLHNEFKTSLVYPSNNNMQPNLQKQTKEILKEVCAMLNADGGTIYIGVNDCGVGIGIATDLNYADFNGEKDKYDLYFRRQVCTFFGKNIDAYMDTRFTNEAGGRIVYNIVIRPYQHPVRLENVIYERHGSSKVAMEGENEKLFIERRYIYWATHKVENKAENKVEPETKIPEVKPMEVPMSPLSNSPKEITSFTSKVREEDKIKVSKLRPEAPLSYEAAPNVIRYIQFLAKGYRLVSDYYSREDSEVYLTLDVKEEDSEKFLILAYQDGTVCKIPMGNILDKNDRSVYTRYTGERLLFAEIASNDDMLMSVAINKHSGKCLRLDSIEKLVQKESLSAIGEPICTASLESYIQFDIIPPIYKLSLKENIDLSPKQQGRNINPKDKYYKELKKYGVLE